MTQPTHNWSGLNANILSNPLLYAYKVDLPIYIHGTIPSTEIAMQPKHANGFN